MEIRARKIYILGGLISGVTYAAQSEAGTATTTLPVSASVSANCVITTTSALNFGAYDPITANVSTALIATGILSVACTKGASGLSIGLNLGGNTSGGQRYFDANHTFSYNVYKPSSNIPNAGCAYASPWGDNLGVNTFSISNSTSKTARTYNVCGQIPAGQDVAIGNYSDTITAKIYF